ncbi:ATP-binding cassette domain-containing protein [Mycoplasma flocculare]|uniref:ATP-binding cassette domain-containing protein n=1 Tax=Mesomycoplasma flocculare TaxID=2128 RepID=A0AAW9XDS8_MESFC|nr:ATP-binding cassette domain-containing protein [Mesomycoplasma flocculare]MXR06127.1 ATP-binding cassette domain-containing protein [Mesomycoplasma flocculare]MXR39683.1 ATP-binding cassette domain-containing protein [Mycoplasma sp. MF12]MXR56329.1 ATP-binding cassette domain-containing protein [Mesomycoplasma flocculare]MXR56908.1 ATP-binding cassette domain-containing protein [Mesomycoplasma flocculare]
MIQIRNVTKKLGSKIILDNISVDIPANKLTFISGQSGVGKTTLLHIIAKITHADSGQISFFDENQKQIKNPKVDIVFQDFNLIDNISAVDNVRIGTNILGRNFKQEEFRKNANFLNLDDSIFKTKMENLSGGEKQRISILRSLNRGSEFILFDEPTASLDKENELIIFEKIKQMSRNHTIVVISHNIEMVKKYADQVIFLQKNSQPVTQINEILPNKTEILPEIPATKLKKISKIAKLKNKLRISPIFVIADISKKLTLSILIIIAFLAAVFSISFAFQLNLGTGKVARQQKYTLSLDKNLIEKKSKATFNHDEINQISNFESVSYVVAKQSTTDMNFFYENRKASLDYTDQIEINKFFKDRIENNIINFEGRFIENINEVILSNSIAEKLKIENPIGQTIYLAYGKIKEIKDTKNKIPLKIVGINHGIKSSAARVNNSFNFINFPSFIATDTIQSLENLVIKNINLEKKQEKKQLFSEISSYIPNENIKDSPLIPFKIQLKNTEIQPENLKLITGSISKKVDEILISTTAIDLNAKYKLKVGDIIQTISPLDQKVNLVVTGIFESQISELYYHKDAKEFYSRFQPIQLAAYLRTTDENNDLDAEAKSAKFELKITPPSNLIRVITSQSLEIIAIINKVTFAVFIIFVIILIAFILVYAKTISESKQKMIGILKALGGSTLLTLFYHVLNIILISLVVLGLSFITIFPSMESIHMLIVGNDLPAASKYHLMLILLFSWAGLSTVFILIYVLMSLITYKKSTQQLLR